MPGLFAVGEVSGGVHGADRPGGNNLADCQVFGYRGRRAAAALAAERPWKPKSAPQQEALIIQTEAEKLEPVRASMDKALMVVRRKENLKELEMESFNHIIHNIQRVSRDLVESMKALPTATIYEASGGKGALFHYIKPIKAGMRLCGPVIPVMTRPGDNLIVHKAIYVAQPGDVLLVGTSSFVEAGFWGGIMTEAAQQRGIAGLVTDGAVRDTDEIINMDFPVFSQGISIKGTTKTCLGTINHPMHFGGVGVEPGDLIVGDSDGVVVVAREDVTGVL